MIKISKIFTIISFIFFILILFIINGTPLVTGYELSIYDSFPLYFWILYTGMYFFAILNIYLKIIKNNKSINLLCNFTLILLGNFVLLILPLLRGYCYFGGANSDLFSHMGHIREISQSGYFIENNFYPIIHIFIQQLSDILAIDASTVIQFIPSFFSVLFPVFIYLLAKSISEDRNQALLISCLSFPLIFSTLHLTIHPAFFSFVFIPLLLFLYHKTICFNRYIEMKILIIILCFSIVFFHPITTLISIVIFITFRWSLIFVKEIKKYLHLNNISIQDYKPTNIILILVITFLAWYLSTNRGLSSVQFLYNSIAYGSELTMVTKYLSLYNISNLTIFQSIRLIFLKFGPIILLSTTAFFCLLIVIRKLLFSRIIKQIEYSYSLQLIASFLFAIFTIFSGLLVINILRAIRYFLLIAIIIIGLICYSILKKTNTKKERRLFRIKSGYTAIFLLLFLSVTLCIFNVYPSPYTFEPNGQFTYTNFAGSTWFADNRDISINISSDKGSNIERIEHYLNGIIIGNLRIKSEIIITPTHFGYQNGNSLLNDANFTETYLITTENGRQAINAFPENIQSKIHSFTKENSDKLTEDINVIQIYCNGEFEVRELNAK